MKRNVQTNPLTKRTPKIKSTPLGVIKEENESPVNPKKARIKLRIIQFQRGLKESRPVKQQQFFRSAHLPTIREDEPFVKEFPKSH